MLRTCRAFLVPVLVAMSLSACSSWVNFPYRINVRQGNYVTQEMVDQLELAMTKDQARYIMGSPLLVDPFHEDRWDYVYRFSPGYGDVELRHVLLVFEKGLLFKIEGRGVPPDSDLPGDIKLIKTKLIEIGTPIAKSTGATTAPNVERSALQQD